MFDIANVIYVVPWFEYKLSLVELWATLLGLWFVIAFRKESIWAYPIGIINSIGFIAIFYQVQLYSDLLLNAYFILISLLGWYWWLRKDSSGKPEVTISFMTWSHRTTWILAIGIFTYVLGSNIDLIFSNIASLFVSNYEHIPAATPYWDALTTVMSIAAMYLLTRKYVEAWLLWVIIDVICICLYFYRDIPFLALEYLVFLANAVLAVKQWGREASLINQGVTQ